MTLPSRIPLKDGTALLLRRAVPEDAEQYIANVNRIASERNFLMTESFTRAPEDIRAQFRDAEDRSALWLIAEIDGKLVGGANFVRGRWAKNAHTADLGVALLPEYRGRGIGEELLQEGIAWARRVGVRKLKLGVFASNERALSLYRKLGFVEEARLKDEIEIDGNRLDEILMALWV